ncbi:MAG: PstS family phosphate ABC transporter substrate-binding protein [Phycisphaeraceae bacterium]
MFTTLKKTAFVAGAAIALATGTPAQAELAGQIKIDGSSTVYPITQFVAETFHELNDKVKISVGFSGTGGGMKKFAAGETDISNASRPIKAKEMLKLKEAGIDFVEIPVAYDGLSIVVNKNNTWADKLTVDQLKKMFLSSNKDKVKTWKDIDASWPAIEIKMYIPGTDSGTFDYFKEVVVGKSEDAIRDDVSESEDDNVLVTGITGDRGAIGFFGAAYYFANKDKLRSVPIVNKAGKAVGPNPKNIESGDYNPFSRPLFIYVKASSLERPEVKAFIDFYLSDAGDFSEEVGYVALPGMIYDRAEANVKNKKTGTQYLTADGEKVEGPVTEVYK